MSATLLPVGLLYSESIAIFHLSVSLFKLLSLSQVGARLVNL